MKEAGQTVQSVERALQILECFTLEAPERTLGEIAQQTGLSKSTVFRLLTTLAGCGYIYRDPVSQKYSLGFKLFHLGAVVLGHMKLRKIALPFMKRLCDEILETVSLSIVEGDQRVCIEVVESPEQIRNFVKVGQRNNLWFGASGRVLLAHLEKAERRHILAQARQRGELAGDEDRFEQELEHIRKLGYSLAVDERAKGAFAIAAPIFDYNQQLAGGVTVSGPVQRLTDERLPLLIRKVVETAYHISQAIGYQSGAPSPSLKENLPARISDSLLSNLGDGSEHKQSNQ
ncbi:IclR family transcriptional regulator [Bacillaceae bacterium]